MFCCRLAVVGWLALGLVSVSVEIMASNMSSKSYWTLRRHARVKVQQSVERMLTADYDQSVEHAHVEEETRIVAAEPRLQHAYDDEVRPINNNEGQLCDMEQLAEQGLEPNERIDLGNEATISDEEGRWDVSDFTSESDSECEDLAQALSDWCVAFRISQTAISALLAILRVHHSELPKDPRTLLRTVQHYDIKETAGGQYFHFGLGHGILAQFAVGLEPPENLQLSVQISIDGLPLFKSTNDQFWPILGMLDHDPVKRPFIIGLFYGNTKPTSAQDFLADFLAEMAYLEDNGLSYEGHHYHICVSAFICDAPARAFVKNVKSHSGYAGCDQCTTHGEWQGKMTFPETCAPLRTDAQFDEMEDEDHHLGPSPFQGSNIRMVSQFPPDYMHLACLGVMKRLLHTWMRGPLNTRMGSRVINLISESILALRNFIPREFARKPRSLLELDRWKATEFRQFLLYTGPLVLLRSLPEHVYNHFLLFHVALFILVSPVLSQRFSDYAHQLLIQFVNCSQTIYGEGFVVYNVHGLIHLPNAVQRFGNLDKISAFPFENFLCKLKRLVRKPRFPLQQIIRRMSEMEGRGSCRPTTKCGVKFEHHAGPVPVGYQNGSQFSQMIFKDNVCITRSEPDNCVKIGAHVCLVRNILLNPTDGEVFIVYEQFLVARAFYSYPLSSNALGIYQVTLPSGHMEVCHVREITEKYLLLPHEEYFITFPMNAFC